MKMPSKADIKRIKEDCTEQHNASTKRVKSRLIFDRENPLYCVSSEHTRLRGFVAASMHKTIRLEIKLLSLNIARWKATLVKIRGIVDSGGSTHLIDKYQNSLDADPKSFATPKHTLYATIQKAESKIAILKSVAVKDKVDKLCR